MHSLAGKVVAGGVLGLPSLSRKKPRRTSSGPPRLRRTWTLTSGTADGATSSTAMAALPIPFMEVSVSVLDTLDVLRSSIEEEVGDARPASLCTVAALYSHITRESIHV